MSGTWIKLAISLIGCAAIVSASGSAAQPTPGDFRAYILKAVEKLDAERRLGGYNINKVYTQDLRYGSECCITASKPLVRVPGPNPTMCVAAVTEVMVEALNLYGKETGDWSFASRLPISSWKRGTTTSIKANVFMFEGAGSYGTAYALQKFGIGQHKPFPELRAGDFINLNRTTRSGHAVVFLGFLNTGASGVQAVFSPTKTVGFRYFSAQGQSRPDGGFGYRNAYFSGACPTPRGRDDDCNVIKAYRFGSDGEIKQNQILLNSGEMFAPARWKVEEAMALLEQRISRSIEEETGLTRGAGLEEAVRSAMERELVENTASYADGTDAE